MARDIGTISAAGGAGASKSPPEPDHHSIGHSIGACAEILSLLEP